MKKFKYHFVIKDKNGLDSTCFCKEKEADSYRDVHLHIMNQIQEEYRDDYVSLKIEIEELKKTKVSILKSSK